MNLTLFRNVGPTLSQRFIMSDFFNKNSLLRVFVISISPMTLKLVIMVRSVDSVCHTLTVKLLFLESMGNS